MYEALVIKTVAVYDYYFCVDGEIFTPSMFAQIL